GWKSRDLVLGDDAPRVVSGGIFRAFALVRGRAVATWTISRHSVCLKPFGPLTRADQSALESEAKDVEHFLSNCRTGLVGTRTRGRVHSRRPISIASHSSPLVRRNCLMRRPSSTKPNLR